jgi:hypothetical protein|mmetsp:Transcript_9714/g.14954  ORF Transcript_9714/g.14954 Transcript_9714/m.14954 type:complete len:255 (+) Transcript_9714:1261-2025(+)
MSPHPIHGCILRVRGSGSPRCNRSPGVGASYGRTGRSASSRCTGEWLWTRPEGRMTSLFILSFLTGCLFLNARRMFHSFGWLRRLFAPAPAALKAPRASLPKPHVLHVPAQDPQHVPPKPVAYTHHGEAAGPLHDTAGPNIFAGTLLHGPPPPPAIPDLSCGSGAFLIYRRGCSARCSECLEASRRTLFQPRAKCPDQQTSSFGSRSCSNCPYANMGPVVWPPSSTTRQLFDPFAIHRGTHPYPPDVLSIAWLR